jgi:hypothetical protein
MELTAKYAKYTKEDKNKSRVLYKNMRTPVTARWVNY